ncbi:alanine racemase [Patescibacteria group bacterium]
MRTHIEISRAALSNNIKVFRKLVGKKPSSTEASPRRSKGERILSVVVKANAYGHGLVKASEIFLKAGADWLIVDSIEEGIELRESGIEAPILIVGYVPLKDLGKVFDHSFRIVIFNQQTAKKLSSLANSRRKKIKVHVKIETGTTRQGITPKEIIPFIKTIKSDYIDIEGALTHFANIEDVLEHDFADNQLDIFKATVELLKAHKLPLEYIHCANSAAAILFPKTYFNMVRVGIAAYGMWPSQETKLSAMRMHRNQLGLQPAMTVKSMIAQIKDVPAGSFIGYGCTYKTTKRSKIAVVPIGYYDGYDRKLSNTGYVLIHGKRAPVRGRVCMNMIMVDISDISNVRLEDPVVIMGKQRNENISAEQLGEWIGTINYEVTTRFREDLPRVVKK